MVGRWKPRGVRPERLGPGEQRGELPRHVGRDRSEQLEAEQRERRALRRQWRQLCAERHQLDKRRDRRQQLQQLRRWVRRGGVRQKGEGRCRRAADLGSRRSAGAHQREQALGQVHSQVEGLLVWQPPLDGEALLRVVVGVGLVHDLAHAVRRQRERRAAKRRHGRHGAQRTSRLLLGVAVGHDAVGTQVGGARQAVAHARERVRIGPRPARRLGVGAERGEELDERLAAQWEARVEQHRAERARSEEATGPALLPKRAAEGRRPLEHTRGQQHQPL